MPRSVQRADYVVADSENTRNDVICLLGMPADRVTVVPGGVDPSFRPVTDPARIAAFRQTIGLDELSVRQNEGEVRETVVSLGKQLSRRWYVGYERSLNATAGTWQLIYRIAQRFTLRAQSGEDSSLDVIWTWRWR